MSDKTTIEWTDATWNPITGCSMVSPGCTHCYAMTLAGGRLRNHPSRKGLTRLAAMNGPVWTGEVRFNEEWLDQPLRWKKPRRVFVCAHGDLFHEDIPHKWIDRVFAVMSNSTRHTYQVLTKRPDRMREYLLARNRPLKEMESGLRGEGYLWTDIPVVRFPLPHVWLGVSAEDQQRADERIPVLLDTPAAVRFVSLEPLLGPIDVSPWVFDRARSISHMINGPAMLNPYQADAYVSHPLDWVIVGGESGPGARPMHPDWARSIRDECLQASVPFHFKQWGEWSKYIGGFGNEHIFEDGQAVLRVGKKKAGRILDGITWDQFPQERSTA